MTLVLDAGAFLAAERGHRDLMALLKAELQAKRAPRSHGGVIAQVWRGGSGRQTSLARLMPAVDVAPLDDQLGRRAGVLLGRARMDDAIDAAVVLIAIDEDTILTSDPDDLSPLAAAAGIHVDIVSI